MSDGRFKKITKRVTRFFRKEKPEPRSLSASKVIRPEEAVPRHGKKAPHSTRKVTRPEDLKTGVTVTETMWGVTHVAFHDNIKAAAERRARPPEPDDPYKDTVRVRDPVTRRLSRKKLADGMKRTTGFYNQDGTLIDETNTDW